MQSEFHSFAITAVELLFFVNIYASPQPMITPAPEYPKHLVQRQDTGPNVYGYISGDINSPLGCGAGYQWQHQDEFGACCNEATCTSAIFTCVNSGEPNPCAGESSFICAMGGSMISALSCNSPTPSCFQYMVMTGPQDTNPAYVPRCGKVSTVIEVFASATNEAQVTSTGDIFPTTKDEIATTPTSTKSRTQSINSSEEQSSSKSPGSSVSTALPSPSQQINKSNNNDNTVIIAVTSAFILAVAILIGAVFLRRRVNKRRPLVDTQIPPLVNTIRTNYGGSDDGTNPVLENEAKLKHISEWSSQVSNSSSNSVRAGLLSPSSVQTYGRSSINSYSIRQ